MTESPLTKRNCRIVDLRAIDTLLLRCSQRLNQALDAFALTCRQFGASDHQARQGRRNARRLAS
jgi:hypothetical protein